MKELVNRFTISKNKTSGIRNEIMASLIKSKDVPIKIFLLILTFTLLPTCTPDNMPTRERLDLRGIWQFAPDKNETGIDGKWFQDNLPDSVRLPGTTDSNNKGILNTDTTTMHLSRIYKYEGAAWYRKKVIIPDSFADKHIRLCIERTKSSMLWVDSLYVGNSSLLQTPQFYDITDYITPGEHTITLCIDNSLSKTPYGNVHIYSDDTQTNWNGLLGDIYLEATPASYITNLKVYPDIKEKKIRIKMEIDNHLNIDEADISLRVKRVDNGRTKKLKTVKTKLKITPVMEFEYSLEKECKLWDEYQTPIYYITAEIKYENSKDSYSSVFGMRQFSASGSHFEINGRRLFLRGKHDAAVFPLTGYTPMNVEEWLNVFRVARAYGINHYRFHSYCPPEAAFTAADISGIYIQAELPFWGGLEADSIASLLRKEGIAMLDAYANHPSFVMLSHGNEIWSGHERVEENIYAFKKYDERVAYTAGSNNNIGFTPPPPCSDFFIGARTPYPFDTTLTHLRLSQCYADSKEGGILNSHQPSTDYDFSNAIAGMNIPVISHETGQYQIYPDFSELEKYTGILKPWNLEAFRKRLIKAGMGDQAVDFCKASGKWAALCYKAEMETALRTADMAGFQLLDLQDYPGQGTALVGILDAFMDSKNVISREEWLQSCNDVVLLLEFPRYCWTNKEKYTAKVLVANYSNKDYKSDIAWEVHNQAGETLIKGSLSDSKTIAEGLSDVGKISFDLIPFTESEKLTVYLSLKNTLYSNQYPLWVYNTPDISELSNDIIITTELNDNIIVKTTDGAKVLFMPEKEKIKEGYLPGHFPPEFWNYGMFKNISEWVGKPVSPGTLGLLINPDHPLFNFFPTDSHTDWQWYNIIMAGNSLILDSTSNDYRPVVQVIDNIERNHKLGLIFEFKLGKGRLLVCMSQLDKIKDKPEASQLYYSILKYMKSERFNPSYEIEAKTLNSWFSCTKPE